MLVVWSCLWFDGSLIHTMVLGAETLIFVINDDDDIVELIIEQLNAEYVACSPASLVVGYLMYGLSHYLRVER